MALLLKGKLVNLSGGLAPERLSLLQLYFPIADIDCQPLSPLGF